MALTCIQLSGVQKYQQKGPKRSEYTFLNFQGQFADHYLCVWDGERKIYANGQTYTHLHTCIHYVHTHTHTHTHTHPHIHRHHPKHTCMYLCVTTHTHMHIHTLCTCIHMLVCTHTHTCSVYTHTKYRKHFFAFFL